MTASASITVSGTISGLPSGSETVSLTLSSSSASGAITSTALASGANTISVPSGAKWVIITPPSGNSTALTFKGVTGDTGVLMHPTEPSIFAMASSVSSFCVTAGALMSSPTTFQFI